MLRWTAVRRSEQAELQRVKGSSGGREGFAIADEAGVVESGRRRGDLMKGVEARVSDQW